MATVNEQTVDAINIANTKTIAEQAAAGHARRNEGQVGHLTRLELMAEAELAANNTLIRAAATKGAELLLTIDVAEALGLGKTARADLPSNITELLAALASSQQGAKVAQTTPPETGGA